eukprot:EG_transcript_6844
MPVAAGVAQSLSYVARFGQDAGWNGLHETRDWQPASPHDINNSEAVQRAHFTAFFALANDLRFGLCPKSKVLDVVARVQYVLCKMRSSRTWLVLRRALKAHVTFKRCTREFRYQVTAGRQLLLADWIGYWRDAELKAQNDLRRQLQSPKLLQLMSPRKARQFALAHALTFTPEAVKERILWDLYWLLRVQYGRRLTAHLARWIRLTRRRARLRGYPPPMDTADFFRGEPRTLRAVNAALFVSALQEPKFDLQVGRGIHFKDLLQFAGLQHSRPDPPALPPALKDASPTAVAFLASPLCREPKWLLARFAALHPPIPPFNWSSNLTIRRLRNGAEELPKLIDLVAAEPTPRHNGLGDSNGSGSSDGGCGGGGPSAAPRLAVLLTPAASAQRPAGCLPRHTGPGSLPPGASPRAKGRLLPAVAVRANAPATLPAARATRTAFPELADHGSRLCVVQHRKSADPSPGSRAAPEAEGSKPLCLPGLHP